MSARRVVEKITAIMNKHDEAINNESGERPFNEEGEALQAIDYALRDDAEVDSYLRKVGWIQ